MATDKIFSENPRRQAYFDAVANGTCPPCYNCTNDVATYCEDCRDGWLEHNIEEMVARERKRCVAIVRQIEEDCERDGDENGAAAVGMARIRMERGS